MDILPLLVPLEKAINMVVQSNDAIKSQLVGMQGKSFGVNVKGLEAQIYIVFSADKVYFQQHLMTPPTVQVVAYPFSLLRLMMAEQVSPKQLEDIAITGDMLFAQQCKAFFRALKIDWQYYLAPILGDVAVETADQFIQKAKSGLHHLFKQLNDGAVNYLQNEINYLPHPNAMGHYIEEVNEFRDGVERLQARLSLLKKENDSK